MALLLTSLVMDLLNSKRFYPCTLFVLILTSMFSRVLERNCLDYEQAVAGFMSEATKNSVSFDPSQLVLTSGAASAIEILSFCLADSGNAFLVPTPCSPG